MPDDRSISILLIDEDLGTAQELARTMRVDLQILPKAQMIDPFTAILIGGGILLTGKFVVDLIDRLRGGVVIDLRPAAHYLVRRDRSLPYGWVVVEAPDGQSVKIETRDAPKDAAERLLSTIINGTLKTAQDVAKNAKEVLGEDKVQSPPTGSV